MNINTLLTRYPLVTDQVEHSELRIILQEFVGVQSREVQGDVVEFGCYAGTTSLFLKRLIDPTRTLHVYDSFEGLPEKTSPDQSPAGQQFKAGELAVTKSHFVRNFRKAGLALPIIHKGWFNELTPNDIPLHIAFAFLDGDYYDSILQPLQLIWSRLSPGAVVVVDDYQNEALPGAARAVDDWLKTNRVEKFKIQDSLAVMVTTAR